MIISFKHKGLERFFKTGSTSGIQVKHQKKLSLILHILNEAESIDDLDITGYRLHPLVGNLCDHWSIKVDGNWRITFKFKDGDAEIVNYQDYH